jgi:hypothetical protein
MGWIAGSLEDVKKIDNWFIVDIGFSNNKESCGIVTVKSNGEHTKDEIHYGAMVEKIQEFVGEIKEGKSIGLIIEAPLSIAFNNTPGKVKDGNPVGRKGIEKDDTSTRYWYVGAGAAVTLATINFLHKIKHEIGSKNVYLFEGLVSFKTDTKKELSHQRDALALYAATQRLSNKTIEKQEETIIMFIGDYLDISLGGRIPSVIKVSGINDEIPTYSFHEFQQNENK